MTDEVVILKSETNQHFNLFSCKTVCILTNTSVLEQRNSVKTNYSRSQYIFFIRTTSVMTLVTSSSDAGAINRRFMGAKINGDSWRNVEN